MRLASFILSNEESILAEWDAFARTCAPASGSMDMKALRDHAGQMLTVIAADLMDPQSRAERSAKSESQGAGTGNSTPTAAEDHGTERAESGFTVEQMVAEYRALRATVIRLWTKEVGILETEHIEDLTRFNEAVDQALAEAVSKYNQQVEQSKELFLGILGHDLRLPLGAIQTSATFMLETGELQQPHKMLAERVANSARRTVAMVADLLDFTRGRLGGGIPVECVEEISLSKIVHDVVDEVASAHPARTIRVETRGDYRGCWDEARMGQAIGNLVTNAVQHGRPDREIAVEVREDEREATVVIHNSGVTIPTSRLAALFDPMKGRHAAGKSPPPASPVSGLGLGLYIADRIVAAHGGRIDVESSDERGTTFTVRLPCRK